MPTLLRPSIPEDTWCDYYGARGTETHLNQPEDASYQRCSPRAQPGSSGKAGGGGGGAGGVGGAGGGGP